MATKIVGVSLPERTLRSLDRLAKAQGSSRSAMVGWLVERASENHGTPDVRVDGRRFVPEKKGDSRL